METPYISNTEHCAVTTPQRINQSASKELQTHRACKLRDGARRRPGRAPLPADGVHVSDCKSGSVFTARTWNLCHSFHLYQASVLPVFTALPLTHQAVQWLCFEINGLDLIGFSILSLDTPHAQIPNARHIIPVLQRRSNYTHNKGSCCQRQRDWQTGVRESQGEREGDGFLHV